MQPQRAAASEIEPGTLGVELRGYGSDGSYLGVIEDGVGSDVKLFNESNWQPGMAGARFIQVVNVGDLPASYTIWFTVEEASLAGALEYSLVATGSIASSPQAQWQAMGELGQVRATGELATGAVQTYRLEYRWPNHGDLDNSFMGLRFSASIHAYITQVVDDGPGGGGGGGGGGGTGGGGDAGDGGSPGGGPSLSVPTAPGTVNVVPPGTPEPGTGSGDQGGSRQDGTTSVIESQDVPLTGTNVFGLSIGTSSWALVNLLCCTCGVFDALLFLLMLIVHRRRVPWRLLNVVVAVMGVLLFLFTEDMRLPMVLVDEWTIWMALLLLIEVVFSLVVVAGRDRRDEREEERDDGRDAYRGAHGL
jgi:hypothetical protein